MEHRDVAIRIVRLINEYSRYYHARLSRHPRTFASLSGRRKLLCLRHGIIIEKYYDVYWMSSKAFVFLPDIVDYVRHYSKVNTEFAERAKTLSFNMDDIERMVFCLSHDSVKLCMRGRKIFDYSTEILKQSYRLY